MIELLSELATAEARYLLIGGHALSFHATPRFTKDVDFWVGASADDVARMQKALHAFGAPEATIAAVAELSGLDVAWMGTPPVRFDFMKEVPGGDFEAAWSRRVQTVWDGAPVNVISADDLLTLKRASGRPQDLLDVDALLAQRR